MTRFVNVLGATVRLAACSCLTVSISISFTKTGPLFRRTSPQTSRRGRSIRELVLDRLVFACQRHFVSRRLSRRLPVHRPRTTATNDTAPRDRITRPGDSAVL